MIPTPEQRAEWRALAEAAYPGPWDHWPEAGWVEVTADDHGTVIAGQVRPRLGFGGEIYVDNDEPTAAFIAASRQAVPALLDALDQAERERDEARATKDMHKERAERIVRDGEAAIAAVERVRTQAQGWIDEYGDPVYRDNGWAQGVVSAATEVIRTLDGGGES